jgi:two-component system, cell cycle sensor histidine kinase and response regulator CckA
MIGGSVSSPAALHLLHLEDSLADAELIRLMLAQDWPDCRIERVETKSDFVAALRHRPFDLILSDFSIPGFDGLTALALARQIQTDTPFVFLSGTIGEDNAVEALKNGATDYVIKDRMLRLNPVVRRALKEVGEHRSRQQAERRLREQAELLDKARDAIYVRDLENRVLYWNQAAERIFGYSAAEMAERPASDPPLLGQDPAAFSEAGRILRERGEWTGEFRAINKAKQSIDLVARWTLVRDERGVPRSILCIDSDVTEQKKLEKQFLRAQRLESVGLLAGGIAHDLNNVLAPILLSVPLMRDMSTDPAITRLLGVVESSAQHGAGLVQQVLAFSRGVDGERVVLHPQKIIGEVAQLLAETLPRSIVIETETPRDLWQVRSDATQLSQVLMNLGVNARDAMPEGGQLRLRAGNIVVDEALARSNPGAQPGPYVRITVSDTGTGIAPEVRDRIFDPFFTTKEIGRGTGLGLSTVLGIVKSHGGFLQMHSEVGRGTEFGLYFPAVLLADAPKPDAVAGSRPGKETILVIDDEENVRSVVDDYLKSAGYRVLTASGGAAGLEIYRQRGPEIDVVLTDLMMPAMQGGEVMRRLRAMNPAVRVVAMSGMLDRDALGGDSSQQIYLQKPMSGPDLLRAIERVLPAAAAASPP